MHGTDMIFILNDIKRNGVSLLWNTIQITAVALIAIYLLQAFFDYRQVEQKISRMTEHTEIYMFRDQTGDAALKDLINDKKKCKKMAENYEMLQRKLQENFSRVKAFTADDSVVFPMYRGQRGEIRRALNLSKEQEELSRIQVSENFFDIYGIQWEGDREAFVKEKTDAIPIVVGADLKKLYQLHDILYDQQTQEYEIVGFMDKDSFYVAPGKTREKICLDQSVIQYNRVDKEDIFHFIREHKREFAIHQMCGARRKTICIRILIPMWGMYAVMCVIALVEGGNTKAAWISILVLACYMLAVSLIPCLCMRKDTIRGMLQKTLN